MSKAKRSWLTKSVIPSCESVIWFGSFAPTRLTEGIGPMMGLLGFLGNAHTVGALSAEGIS